MQTIRTKVLFISLLFSAVMLPTMMQANKGWKEIAERLDGESDDCLKSFYKEKEDFYEIYRVLEGEGSKEEKSDQLGQLLAGGVSIDARYLSHSKKPTNLIVAALFLDPSKVVLLIEKKADVNALGEYGQSPLMRAIGSEFGTEEDRLEVIRLLLGHGAKDLGKNERGQSIWTLALAANNPEIMEMLTKHFNQ